MDLSLWILLGGVIVLLVVVGSILVTSEMTKATDHSNGTNTDTSLSISIWSGIKLGFGFAIGFFLAGMLLFFLLATFFGLTISKFLSI